MSFDIHHIKDAYGSSLSPGNTARENHANCPSGVDRRRRLYISKTTDGAKLKCYCHNCGQGTVIDLGSIGYPVRPLYPPPVPVIPALPKPADPSNLLLPRHKRWLEAYGIDTCYNTGAYSASKDALVFNYKHGHQIRYFDGREPKWMSYGNPVAYSIGDPVLVVEDIVSALKWNRLDVLNGYVSLAGHRPNMPAIVPANFKSHYIVWLDNDKPSVVEAAAALAYELSTESAGVVLIEGGTDPKRYPLSELKQVSDVCNKLFQSAPPDGRPYHVLKVWSPGEGVRAGAGVSVNPS